jgi:hypothetical protein
MALAGLEVARSAGERVGGRAVGDHRRQRAVFIGIPVRRIGEIFNLCGRVGFGAAGEMHGLAAFGGGRLLFIGSGKGPRGADSLLSEREN